MKLLSQSVMAVLLMAVTGISQAAEVVRVNSMNYPAWLIRDHQTLPLQPGAELRGEDLVRTGNGGRVLLQMADGSAVKLGESARFVVETAAMRDDQGGSFLESTFQVLRGAFRFTSRFFGETDAGHRVQRVADAPQRPAERRIDAVLPSAAGRGEGDMALVHRDV